MRDAGCSILDIAATLGRSRSSVKSRIDKLVSSGSAPKLRTRWSDDEHAAILKMRSQGRTGNEIARALGRTPKATQKRIHDLLVARKIPYLTAHAVSQNHARIRATRTARDQTNARKILLAPTGTIDARDTRDGRGRVTALRATKDLGYVVGVLYGDGYLHTSRMSLALRSRDSSFVDAFTLAVKRSLTSNVKRLSRIEPIKRAGRHVYRDLEYHEAWIHDRHFVSALMTWTGPTTTREWAISLDDAKPRGTEYCDGLIQGLFDSDGSFCANGARGMSMRFGTASATGAKSLYDLMVWRGYNVHLAPVNAKGEHRISVRASSAIRYALEISSRITYKRARLRRFLIANDFGNRQAAR